MQNFNSIISLQLCMLGQKVLGHRVRIPLYYYSLNKNIFEPLTSQYFTVILAHAYIIPPNFNLSFDFRTTRHNGMIFGTVDQNTRTALYLVMFEGKVRNLIFCIHKVKSRIKMQVESVLQTYWKHVFL